MAHVHVAKGKGIVQLDGFTIHEGEAINIDVSKPLAAARIADGTLVQDDSATPPAAPRGLIGVVKSGAVSDADFPSPPPVGTFGFDSTANQLYIKTGANPSVWKKSAAYT